MLCLNMKSNPIRIFGCPTKSQEDLDASLLAMDRIRQGKDNHLALRRLRDYY